MGCRVSSIDFSDDDDDNSKRASRDIFGNNYGVLRTGRGAGSRATGINYVALGNSYRRKHGKLKVGRGGIQMGDGRGNMLQIDGRGNIAMTSGQGGGSMIVANHAWPGVQMGVPVATNPFAGVAANHWAHPANGGGMNPHMYGPMQGMSGPAGGLGGPMGAMGGSQGALGGQAKQPTIRDANDVNDNRR